MKAKKEKDDCPIHFRDKLDEYLYHEHGILAGCCSSIESLKYDVAREVAEKLNDAFIEKACQFIKEHHHEFSFWNTEEYELGFSTKKFIEDFKKYMKGE